VAAPLFLYYTEKMKSVNENQNRPNVGGSGFLGFNHFCDLAEMVAWY